MKNKNISVLDVNYKVDTTWLPPEIPEMEMACEMRNDVNAIQSQYYLHIFQVEPYIDSLFIAYNDDRVPVILRRFIIKDKYVWDYESELFFHDYCIKTERCCYSGGQIDKIYDLYNNKYPEWHLKRYYTKGLRLLDHLYHCMRRNTSKEILYKSGLDELAANIDELDELNVMSSSPSEIYEGLSNKILHNLNCHDGASLVNQHKYRVFIKNLNMKFPDTFKSQLNDAQCRYLKELIDGKVTVGEAGRLFNSRKSDLSRIWCRSLYEVFVSKDRRLWGMEEQYNLLAAIDPIYEKYIKEVKYSADNKDLRQLVYYLLKKRDEYDRAVRRSTRKKDYEWMERTEKYFVRYPQTINDFCREAIYMHSCLMAFVEALIKGDTTILFMRRSEDVNKPFITIEIYDNKLMQAYHRFNEDCTKEEADWIRAYCIRHGISTERFAFDSSVDELY